MTKKACVISGCKSKDFADLFYKHQQFCKSHYAEAFQEDLSILFKEWDGINEPPDRLKYLIGRYYDEHETALIGKPSLTKRIVHEGSYDWKKTENSVIFTAIRFPVSGKHRGTAYCVEAHQTWEFHLETLEFTFLSEEGKRQKIILLD